MYYFLVSGLQGGGAERVCVRLINEFVKHNSNVTLVVMKNEFGPLRELIDSRVRIIALRKNNARYSAFSIYNFLRKEKPKKILAFNFELAALLYLAKKLRNDNTKIYLRVINTISQEVSSKGLGSLKIKIRRFLLNKLDGLIFQCNDMKSDFQKVIQLDDKVETSVIYNPSSYVVHDKVIFNAEHRTNVVFAGRLESQKNISLMLDAFKYALRVNAKLKLYIYGEGSLELSIKDKISIDGISESVILKGFEKDINVIFDCMGLSLLTSDYEGFPNFLLDSISFGIPIVSVNCKSGPSEIINNKNGVLVNDSSSESIGKAILNAVENKWCADSIILDSKSRFGIDKFYNSYYDILK